MVSRLLGRGHNCCVIDLAEEVFCPECGYSLRGIASARCPECGAAIDWESVTSSAIPWMQRKRLGRWRALGRTVWLIMRDPKRVAGAMQHPVRLEDAPAFRRMVVWVTFVPLALGVAVTYVWCLGSEFDFSLGAWNKGQPAMMKLGAVMDWGLLVVMLAGLFAFLLTVTGVQSYFFHPRSIAVERQNRAVALSYYGCGPVVLMPVGLAAVAGCAAVTVFFDPLKTSIVLTALIWIVGLGVFAIPPFEYWINLIRLLRRTTQCSRLRVAMTAVLLPVFWALLFAIVAVGIPAAYFFVCIVILSW